MDPYIHLHKGHSASHVLSCSFGTLCLSCGLYFLAEELLVTRKEVYLRWVKENE